MSLVIVAIGGNVLTRSFQFGSAAEQIANAQPLAEELADMIAGGWQVVLTHGNGPQVGNILRRVELAASEVHPVPLEICDAETQGSIGYILQQGLGNALRRRQIPKTVVSLVTQVVVDPGDPAFAQPSKPIGPFYGAAAAADYMRTRGWVMKEDAGRGWRRVVPSPKPLAIVEKDAVAACLAAGAIPLAVGGGGIPVVAKGDDLSGIEAVIDKDYASSLLASALGADVLILTTAVEQVALDFGLPSARNLDHISVQEMRRHHAAGAFPPGSMGPKVESALTFVEGGGKRAIITNPDNLQRALAGHAGTHITADGHGTASPISQSGCSTPDTGSCSPGAPQSGSCDPRHLRPGPRRHRGER